ncbi:MAG TPA: OsmC family protein [Ignavibacteria bacterium]
MKSELKLEKGMRLAGINELGLITYFDTHPEVGGEDTAPTPLEVMLQSLAGCTAMDVISMLRKRRKTIDDFSIDLEAERAQEHPKVFTKVKMTYNLKSPDATVEEFKNVITLSQDKYCSVSAMFKRSGCVVIWEAKII